MPGARPGRWCCQRLRLGLAARFVSGYLIQLVADVKPLDGPEGPAQDFTDLHAWTEVYLPGAGWVGLDPTSGLLAGEGHIPLACTPHASSAAPITGAVDQCETEFNFTMSVTRIHENPRVTKPYTEAQWQEIVVLGQRIDAELTAGDVRLTMGGEPTFVSIDDMQGDEWNTAALGPTKRRLAAELLKRLKNRFAPGGLLHYEQGKWYPGESLPRWALACYWRKDGVPIWNNEALLADETVDYGHTAIAAERFIKTLADRLEVEASFVRPAYEDIWRFLDQERRLPVNLEGFMREYPSRRCRGLSGAEGTACVGAAQRVAPAAAEVLVQEEFQRYLRTAPAAPAQDLPPSIANPRFGGSGEHRVYFEVVPVRADASGNWAVRLEIWLVDTMGTEANVFVYDVDAS